MSILMSPIILLFQTKYSIALSGFLLLWLWGSASLADSIDNTGACNINANGASNSTLIVHCGDSGSSSSDDILVVVSRDVNPLYLYAYDNFGLEQGWSFHNGFVIDHTSFYKVQIGDFEFKHYISSGKFTGGDFRTKTGDYPFSITLHLSYANGWSSKATCRGILRLNSSIILYPRYRVHVNPANNDLTANICFFNGVQVS